MVYSLEVTQIFFNLSLASRHIWIISIYNLPTLYSMNVHRSYEKKKGFSLKRQDADDIPEKQLMIQTTLRIYLQEKCPCILKGKPLELAEQFIYLVSNILSTEKGCQHIY